MKIFDIMTQKIVINNCYGGFGLSYSAVMRYAELKGIQLHAFIDEISKQVYKERAVIGNPEILHHYTTTPNDPNDGYFNENDIQRDDPILIKVVEEMGETANGHCAELKIVEVPDDVKWEISEYDGAETIEEIHRSWS